MASWVDAINRYFYIFGGYGYPSTLSTPGYDLFARGGEERRKRLCCVVLCCVVLRCVVLCCVVLCCVVLCCVVLCCCGVLCCVVLCCVVLCCVVLCCVVLCCVVLCCVVCEVKSGRVGGGGYKTQERKFFIYFKFVFLTFIFKKIVILMTCGGTIWTMRCGNGWEVLWARIQISQTPRGLAKGTFIPLFTSSLPLSSLSSSLPPPPILLHK
jgi:hypothetical protein